MCPVGANRTGRCLIPSTSVDWGPLTSPSAGDVGHLLGDRLQQYPQHIHRRRLPFRQFSLGHITPVLRHPALDASRRPPLPWHALVPFGLPVQVSQVSQEHCSEFLPTASGAPDQAPLRHAARRGSCCLGLPAALHEVVSRPKVMLEARRSLKQDPEVPRQRCRQGGGRTAPGDNDVDLETRCRSVLVSRMVGSKIVSLSYILGIQEACLLQKRLADRSPPVTQ